MIPLLDTIIVGTGIGGLTAGLRLVRKGHSVLFLEESNQIGGLLNPHSVKRYEFDVGVHCLGELGEGQSMRRVFDSLHLEDLQFREINPACIERYAFGDYETRLVKGIDRWGDVLVKDFPREQASIRKFLNLMKECRELNRVAASGLKLSDLPGMLRYGGDLMRLSRVPLADITAHYFKDPLLRDVFAGPRGDLGLPPGRASAFFSINALNHYLAGGYYPLGGSSAIRDAFTDALRSVGVELLRNQAVTSIRVLGEKRFEVITADESRFEARSVISNVSAKRTVALLDNAKPNYMTRRKVAQFEPSLGSLCVFLATDLNLAKLGITDASIWHYHSADLEVDYEDLRNGRVPDRPCFHLSSPSLKDPTSNRAPHGQNILQLITHAPARPSDTMERQLADRIIEGAERYIPDLREHIVFRAMKTTRRPAHARGQSVLSRMFTKVGIPGLYLAGENVLGGGVMPCMQSGALAAQAALSHLERDAFGQLDDLSRAMSWIGRKATLRTTPQKLHSNLHQLRRDKQRFNS